MGATRGEGRREAGSVRFETGDGSVFSIGAEEGEPGVSDMASAGSGRGTGPAPASGGPGGAEARADSAAEDAGRYRVLREIARGGMGAILEVEDRSLGRLVAMKVMLAVEGARQADVDRFVEEARITGSLEHPNIVPVHELGTQDSGRRYFTMKLVGGSSLSSIVRRRCSGDGPALEEWPLRRLLGVFVQVCNAVSFAHSRGVLHRDLKPDNVMVGDFGEVLVMDWGLAGRAGPGSPCPGAAEGSILGTPAYMPPEQARGEAGKIDQRSDIFALGAMLFEILAGKPPYSGATSLEILGKAAKAEVPAARIPKNAPRSLALICLKAMSPDRDSRYASVRDLAREIEAFLDHRVIPSYSLKSWQKLAQTAAIMVTAVLVVLAMGSWDPAILRHFWDIPSFVGVIAFGAAYHGFVHGWGLLFRPSRRQEAGGLASTASTETLQEGFYFGGMVSTLLGILAILTSMTWFTGPGATVAATHRYYANILISIYAATYYLPILLAARLGFIRGARQHCLFGLISPARPSFLVQLLALLTSVLGTLVGYVAARGDFPALLGGLASAGAIEGLAARAAGLISAGSVLGLLTFRLVFTYRELAAALGHFCSRLAGGEVDRTNRMHAASVIRFLAEASLFWVLYASFAFAIVAARLELVDGEGLIARYTPSLGAAIAAMLAALAAYAALVFGAMRAFAGDGGEAAERELVERAAAALDAGAVGSAAAGSLRRRIGLVTAFAASFAVMVLLIAACGVDLLAPKTLPLYALLLAFQAFALLRRRRIGRWRAS